MSIDLKGLVPAPVTPFTRDRQVDYEAIQRLGSWLGSIKGVKGLVVLGHAGEGTFLSQQEQVDVIKAFVRSVNNRLPIIAGITGEGTEVSSRSEARQGCWSTGWALVPVAWMAPIWLSTWRTSGQVQEGFRSFSATVDPVPISGQHESQLQPPNPPRHRGAARSHCHEEWSPEYAPLGY